MFCSTSYRELGGAIELRSIVNNHKTYLVQDVNTVSMVQPFRRQGNPIWLCATIEHSVKLAPQKLEQCPFRRHMNWKHSKLGLLLAGKVSVDNPRFLSHIGVIGIHAKLLLGSFRNWQDLEYFVRLLVIAVVDPSEHDMFNCAFTEC